MLETIAAIIGTIGVVEIIHFLHKNFIKPRREVNKIHAGYAFVEKGVITQGKGGLFPPEDKNDSNEQFQSGAFNAASGIDFVTKKDDESDMLIFSIENTNIRQITNLGANIGIASNYYSAGKPIFDLNCTWKKDGGIIHVKFQELFPEEKAYIIIPLLSPQMKIVFNNPEEKKRFLRNKKTCYISAWYGSLPLHITKSRVLRKTTGASAVLYIIQDLS